jgi:galactoside O-acetyltransferase
MNLFFLKSGFYYWNCIFINKVRYYYLKFIGVNLSNSTKIFGKVIIIGNPKNLFIGKNVTLNEGVLFNCAAKIIIGDNCRISAYSQFQTGYLNLNLKKPNFYRTHSCGEITLLKNVWIASSVVIGANVLIGENSVIGANSYVSKNVDSNQFCAGSPCKKIKNISFN